MVAAGLLGFRTALKARCWCCWILANSHLCSWRRFQLAPVRAMLFSEWLQTQQSGGLVLPAGPLVVSTAGTESLQQELLAVIPLQRAASQCWTSHRCSRESRWWHHSLEAEHKRDRCGRGELQHVVRRDEHQLQCRRGLSRPLSAFGSSGCRWARDGTSGRPP